MSVKNTLQEFCQKRGYPLPEYLCVREGGQDHSPLWRGQVSCIIEGEEWFFESIDAFASTKEATKQVAQQALDHVNGVECVKSKERERKKKCFREDVSHTFILLDLENVPHSYRDLCEKFYLSEKGEQVSIVGFCSRVSGHIRTKVEREMEKYGIKIHIVEACSSHSDAADIQMCVWVGRMMAVISSEVRHAWKFMDYRPLIDLNAEPPVKIFLNTAQDSIPIRLMLVTGDHFGKSLVDLIGYGTEAIHCPEIKWQGQLYRCIEEMVE